MKMITLLIFILVSGQMYLSVAQSVTDYYRSKTSGSWHDVSTWESSPDSINWSNAAFTPYSSSNTIVIRDGDTLSVLQTITVDQVIVEPNAVIIINGPGADTNVVMHISNGPFDNDMEVHGKIIATGIQYQSPFSLNAVGVLSFEDGSVYEHNQNGGGIPISQWRSGSTLLLNATVDSLPYNRTQNYSNIIVDLPNLATHLNMGFREHTISGDITILNTGQFRWVLMGPVSDTTRSVTIMGNINQSGGNFNTHGTENPNSHAVVHTFGDITVTGGNFSIARASQGGTGTTLWYHHGDLSISNATTQNANPLGAKFIFTGSDEYNVTLENVTYGAGGLPIQVDDGTFNLGTSVLGGGGMFTLNPGAKLATAHEAGLDGALQNTGAITLSTEAGYVFNGTASQVTGQKLPAQIMELSVIDPAGVTLSGDVLVTNEVNISSGILMLGGHTLTLGATAMLNETDGYATGSGKITTTRDIDAPSALDIAGMGVVLTSTANLGSTMVDRFHSTAVVNGSNGISRQYYIAPSNNSGLDATLRLYYLESELDTIQENNLRLYTSPSGEDNSWEFAGGMINMEDNYAEVSGLGRLAYVTLAYGDQIVAVEDEFGGIPTEFSMYQNFPNPFNPETVIRFDLPEESFVNLSVYNLIGEKVATLINEKMNQGRYTQNFNAGNLPSGVYVYRLSAGSSVQVKKMVLMK
jgi:hypothetical protein